MKEMNNIERYTDKELEELASLLSDEKGENTDFLNRFLDEDVNDVAKQWKELKDMSDEKKIDVDIAWEKVYNKLHDSELKPESGSARIKFINNLFIKVAAVTLILISLGTTAVYLNHNGTFSKKITLATDNDHKNLQILLPDGSKVFLNRNSELSYRANLGKYKRDVVLSGEAFFEIAPDASKPFAVDAGNARVKVVGTSFNVISNNKESVVEVFVKTGKVMLSDNSGSKSILLDPGFIGKINTEKSEKKFNQNPNYLSWNTGLLVYNGQKLDIVINDLKRVYNMNIVADDPAILENTWTSPIDNQPQETIIRLICASFNLNYTKDGNVYHLAKK
jgi:transmembrane sensor